LLRTLRPYINPQAARLPDLAAYNQIARSLDVLLVACLGTIIGRVFAAKGERTNQ
jgi:hypothetical protein